jgi:hypothetical protein
MGTTFRAFLTCSNATPQDRQNYARVRAWLLAWMGSWLLATMAIKFGWLPGGAWAVTVTLATALLGVGSIFAYTRFLRNADELRRKIELDALALAFGVGVVSGLTLWLLQRADSTADVDILTVVSLMLVANGFGSFLGHRRYS